MRTHPGFLRRAARSALLAGLIFVPVACGYTFAASPGIARLAAGHPVWVPAFDNRSLEANAATIATAAAAREVSIRGATLGRGKSHLVLVGVVNSIDASPLAPGAPQTMVMWHIQAQLTLELRREGKARPLARAVVTEGTNYLSGNDIEATEVARRVATEHLLEQMATDGVDRLAP